MGAMNSDQQVLEIRELGRSGQAGEIDQRLEGAKKSGPNDSPRVRLAYAALAAVRKRPEDVDEFARGLREADFDADEDLSDFALVALAQGDVSRAERLLHIVVSRGRPDGFALARLGAAKLFKNDLGAAKENLEAALIRLPDRPEILANLAVVCLRQDQFEKAIEYCDRALEIDPNFAAAKEQRRRAQVALGRGEEVLIEREQALENEPEKIEPYLQLASIQGHLEMYAEAEATLNQAIEKFPDEPEPCRRLVQLLFEHKGWSRVGELLFKWCSDDPEKLEWRAQLNRARVEVGFLDAAERDLENWDQEWRDTPSYALVKARLLTERQHHHAALELLNDTLARYPGLHDARSQTIAVLTQLGRIDEAKGHQQFLAKFAPAAAIDSLQNADYTISDKQIESLWAYANSPALGRELRAQSFFALSRIYDSRKEYDSAFDALNRANACVQDQISYDWRQHRRFVQETVSAFSEKFVRQRSGRVGHSSNRPIFVLGMPRSGTTLVEQILASHPLVYGGGELNVLPRVAQLMPKVLQKPIKYPWAVQKMSEGHFADAAQYYLDRVAQIDRTHQFVVDKLPHNFDRIGLIHLMFPNAVVVHMDRDLRDVAVSNYFQNFAAKHGLMGFAFDLGDIGHMLNDHDRVMAHWHALFPGRIYEQSYEALVRDPETQIAKLLAHCGLPWDDKVMRFYETQRPVKTASVRQVREGIYTTSAEKWRRYERHLGPLEQALASGFQPVGQTEGKAAPGMPDAGTTAAGATLDRDEIAVSPSSAGANHGSAASDGGRTS